MVESIGSDAGLLRAVRHDPEYIQPDDNTGGWIPSAKAMTFEHDGLESVFCHHMLNKRGDSPDDVATYSGQPGIHRVIFNLQAGEARNLNFGVTHSPNTVTPIGYAHADVQKPSSTMTHKEFRIVRQKLLNRMVPIDSSQITIERP